MTTRDEAPDQPSCTVGQRLDVTLSRSNLPELLTLAELAMVFRSNAKNRARAGRQIADRLQLPLVSGWMSVLYLVPGWAVQRVIGDAGAVE